MNDHDNTKEPLPHELASSMAEACRLGEIEAIYHTAPIGLCVFDTQFRYLRINDRLAELNGVPADQHLGRTTRDVVPALADWTEAMLRRVIETGQPALNVEFTGTTPAQPDVRRTWIVHWLPLKEATGLVTGVSVVVEEITERKRAEEALRHERNRAQEYLDVAAVIMVVLDSEGKITLLNQKGYEILGYSEGDLLGQDWFVTCVPERIRHDVLAAFRQLIAGQLAPVEYFENPVIAHSGEERIIAWHNALLTDDTGQIIGTLSSGTDITERKRAEEALQKAHAELEERVKQRTAELREVNAQLQREVEERQQAETALNAFFNASTEILNLLDGDLRYIKTDNLTPSYFGLDAQSIVGKSMIDIAPALVEKHGAMMRRVIATGEPVPNLEVRGSVPSRPGEVVYWRTSWFPVPLPDGKRGLGIVGAEITDTKRAEEALRQSEAKYKALVETSPDAVILADLQGKLTFVSHGILDLYGSQAVEEFLGKHALEFVVEEDHQRFMANLKKTLQEGVTRDIEYTFMRKDGSRFPGEVSGAVIQDEAGRPTALMAIVRDITERKQAQEALRQSELRYRELIENQGEGLGIVDTQERFTFANPAGERIFGVPTDGLVGRSMSDFMTQEQYALVLEQTKKRRLGEKGTYELEIIRPDGEVRCLLLTAVPRFDGAGQFIGAFGLFFDITELKRAHEALERERQVLRYMLRASDHERQVIAYDIHDGLAQHLAAALLQFDAFDALRAKRTKQASDAFHAGMTLLRQGHTEARRLISGVRPPILDESGVVAAIAHLVHEPTGRNAPEIEFRSKVRFDRLEATEENAIYRIAQEAVSNVCKHSRSKKARVSLVQRGDRVRIEIRDWGVGFDPARVPKDRYGLTGIRERARLLGGKCKIMSNPGKGAAIIVELPVLERQAEESAARRD
jgi:PAS domain S-box-containing protein